MLTCLAPALGPRRRQARASGRPAGVGRWSGVESRKCGACGCAEVCVAHMVPLDTRQALSYIGPRDAPMKASAWYLAAREVGRTRCAPIAWPACSRSPSARARSSGPRAFDLVGYWQESAARFEAELRHLQARVRVSRRAMGWLHHARTKCAPCPARSTRPAVAGQLGRGATLTASMHLNREVQ
jgi:hypothetical protein